MSINGGGGELVSRAHYKEDGSGGEDQLTEEENVMGYTVEFGDRREEELC